MLIRELSLARSIGLTGLIEAKVGKTDLLVWIRLLQSHHLLLNLELELIMNRNRGLSSLLDLGLFHLAESLKVADGAHHLFGEGVDVLGLFGHVNGKRLSEDLLKGDSLLEQEVEVCHLDLEITGSLSLFTDGSWLVGRELVEESLHQTGHDVFLNRG